VTSCLKIARGAAIAWLFLLATGAAFAQAPETKRDKSAKLGKTSEKEPFPFQIEVLETNVRFESNGDSRKEVHTIVRLNDAMGVREFGQLTFDYNRSFQQVEISMARITHANGGTSDVLPSAVTDAPNPAVEKYPAYQDVRVKAVRILGLHEGDSLDYRVITMTTHHPLAPEFWVEHTFDRSGQVQEEHYELNLPGDLNSASMVRSSYTAPVVYTAVPATSFKRTEGESGVRSIFVWKILFDQKLPPSQEVEGSPSPDVIVSSFRNWEDMARKIASVYPQWTELDRMDAAKRLDSMERPPKSPEEKIHAIYAIVSQQLKTADLPVDSMGFRIRPVRDIFESGYATPNEKCFLLSQFARLAYPQSYDVFYVGERKAKEYPRPSAFQHVFVIVTEPNKSTALDPSREVAPFGLIPAQFRGKEVLSLSQHSSDDDIYTWLTLPEGLPFAAFQKVTIAATLGDNGKLTARVKYTLRGDNELLLRVAFHQTPKEKWKDVAGLLALSDGFRGVITTVDVSDPMATKEPFAIEYELTQHKFVDWAKKPVRIPALLPQIGLPDTSAKTSAESIELGTPLDVDTQMTLQLPVGTIAQTPAGTAVERDYATYLSKYVLTGETLSATRRIHFLRREVGADRAADYNAFAQAVQNDQAQYFVLDREAGVRNAAAQ